MSFTRLDLLTFHDAPTVVEQKLFVTFLEHRMRAFQGTFHANPDYALWYGWSEMQRDLTEIKEEARRGCGATTASSDSSPSAPRATDDGISRAVDCALG